MIENQCWSDRFNHFQSIPTPASAAAGSLIALASFFPKFPGTSSWWMLLLAQNQYYLVTPPCSLINHLTRDMYNLQQRLAPLVNMYSILVGWDFKAGRCQEWGYDPVRKLRNLDILHFGTIHRMTQTQIRNKLQTEWRVLHPAVQFHTIEDVLCWAPRTPETSGILVDPDLSSLGKFPWNRRTSSIINCRCRPSMAKCRSSLHLLHITFQQHLFNKAAMARSLAGWPVTSSQATCRAWIWMAHFCTTNTSIHISIDRLDWVRLDQIGFDILYIWLNQIR